MAALEQIVSLTREVSALAESGEWARAAQVNAERQLQLQAFCAQLEPRTTPRETVEILSRILQLNDALVGSVQRRQQSLLDEADALRAGRRAAAAYGA